MLRVTTDREIAGNRTICRVVKIEMNIGQMQKFCVTLVDNHFSRFVGQLSNVREGLVGITDDTLYLFL
jgi:hypothetical protein